MCFVDFKKMRKIFLQVGFHVFFFLLTQYLRVSLIIEIHDLESTCSEFSVAFPEEFLPFLLRWCFTSIFRTGGSVPSARAACSSTYLPAFDNILLFGGRNRNRRLNDLYLLDLASLVWTQVYVFFSVDSIFFLKNK